MLFIKYQNGIYMKKILTSFLLSIFSFSAFAMQMIEVDATHLDVSNAYLEDPNLRGTFIMENFVRNKPLTFWLDKKRYYPISNRNQAITWKLTYPFRNITNSGCTVILKDSPNYDYVLKVTGNIYTPDGVYPTAYAKPLKCTLTLKLKVLHSYNKPINKVNYKI